MQHLYSNILDIDLLFKNYIFITSLGIEILLFIKQRSLKLMSHNT